jgi:UPF0755 protein
MSIANRKRIGWALIGLLLGGGGGSVVWLRGETQPTAPGAAFYIRFEHRTPLRDVLVAIQNRGAIRNAAAMRLLALVERRMQGVGAGTYEVAPGMTAAQILDKLGNPIRWNVRIPDQNLALRTAQLLESKHVLEASDYVDAVNHPEAAKGLVEFPIEGATLEGYLFPDTYDLAPLTPASDVVAKQLRAFQKKVWEGLGKPANLFRTLTIASLIELEVARDDERPMVAGVIENRLAKGMPLELDATVCYARQLWGPLTIHDLHAIKSPYNTYLNKGLPPGPICSPSLKSIEAAMHPAKHDFLFYVAMPDGHSVFAKTREEHEHNVRLRKLLLAQAGRAHR